MQPWACWRQDSQPEVAGGPTPISAGAGPGDIIKALPAAYLLADRAVYIAAFLAAKGALSPDNIFFFEKGAATAYRALARIDPRSPRPR